MPENSNNIEKIIDNAFLDLKRDSIDDIKATTFREMDYFLRQDKLSSVFSNTEEAKKVFETVKNNHIYGKLSLIYLQSKQCLADKIRLIHSYLDLSKYDLIDFEENTVFVKVIDSKFVVDLELIRSDLSKLLKLPIKVVRYTEE